MLTFHIISLFPNALSSYISESILARAIEKKVIKIKTYDLHDFAENKWRKTDERPYGGGPGMVLLVRPILRAVEKAVRKKKKTKIIILSPSGKSFTNSYGATLAKKYTDIVLICGRYEGIDARVKKILKAEEISVGDFVLTGGELPALVVMDAISRQIPGTLGKFASLEENRISSHEVYTRPEIFEWKRKKYRVPKVLLSGDHKKISLWKQSPTF
ncbi:tRNA (guanosine(37)-N1)-methyltransferase TrmD [bacterium]|nr:tRNA (guanosine(37)-N1)-methyltransferase TrmD [bacterium]